MIYTLEENESFDAEILRQELVAEIGADGWHLNTAGNQVEFVQPDIYQDQINPRAIIEAHFTNGPKREHNKAILKQIAELETKITPRRIREAVSNPSWMMALDMDIAGLRGQLQK